MTGTIDTRTARIASRRLSHDAGQLVTRVDQASGHVGFCLVRSDLAAAGISLS